MNAAFLFVATAWLAGANPPLPAVQPAPAVVQPAPAIAQPGGCSDCGGGAWGGGCGPVIIDDCCAPAKKHGLFGHLFGRKSSTCITTCGDCGDCEAPCAPPKHFRMPKFSHGCKAPAVDCGGCQPLAADCGGCCEIADTCCAPKKLNLFGKLRGLLHRGDCCEPCLVGPACDGCGPIGGCGGCDGCGAAGPGVITAPMTPGALGTPVTPPKTGEQIPPPVEKKPLPPGGKVQVIPQPIGAPVLDITPTSVRSPF